MVSEIPTNLEHPRNTYKKKKNAILVTSEITKLIDIRKFGANLDEMARAIHTFFDSHWNS